MEYFQRLSEALNIYPELKNDEFVKQQIKSDPDFYDKFRINKRFQIMRMPEEKRNMLEGIALEVLELLWQKKKDNIGKNSVNKM